MKCGARISLLIKGFMTIRNSTAPTSIPKTKMRMKSGIAIMICQPRGLGSNSLSIRPATIVSGMGGARMNRNNAMVTKGYLAWCFRSVSRWCRWFIDCFWSGPGPELRTSRLEFSRLPVRFGGRVGVLDKRLLSILRMKGSRNRSRGGRAIGLFRRERVRFAIGLRGGQDGCVRKDPSERFELGLARPERKPDLAAFDYGAEDSHGDLETLVCAFAVTGVRLRVIVEPAGNVVHIRRHVEVVI